MNMFVLEGRQNVVDGNANHRGVRIIFLIMNLIHILEEVKILTMITTNFVERFNEDVIDQRRH